MEKYLGFPKKLDAFPIEVLAAVEDYDPRIIRLYAVGFKRIAAMFTEPDIKRYREYYSMVRTGSHPEHGFDLAKPSEIQQAIDDGRIKPFPRIKGNQR